MTAKTSTSDLVDRVVDYLTEPRPDLMKPGPPGEASDSTVIAHPADPVPEENNEQKTDEKTQTPGDPRTRTG